MKRHVATRCLLVGAVLAAGPAAAEGAWTHTLFVFGMGAAIEGDAQVGPLKVPVDLSISDVFDKREFGAMAADRADNGTWSWTGDATNMGLGGSSSAERGNVRATVDVDQMTLMGTVGRRLTPNLQVLASLRWAASDKVGVYIGYRDIAFDCEDGKDLQYEHCDLTEQGPLAGFSVTS